MKKENKTIIFSTAVLFSILLFSMASLASAQGLDLPAPPSSPGMGEGSSNANQSQTAAGGYELPNSKATNDSAGQNDDKILLFSVGVILIIAVLIIAGYILYKKYS